jgi:hypothetical protein
LIIFIDKIEKTDTLVPVWTIVSYEKGNINLFQK